MKFVHLYQTAYSHISKHSKILMPRHVSCRTVEQWAPYTSNCMISIPRDGGGPPHSWRFRF
uniref:Uncharacterized protein n=1 Tax=Manihot esculenta TaxID=3983 RepID=A0A2C9WEB6_MANES